MKPRWTGWTLSVGVLMALNAKLNAVMAAAYTSRWVVRSNRSLLQERECTAVMKTTLLLVLAAILPLLFTRIVNQNSEHQEATHVWPMLRLRQARLGVNGCIISGIVLGSLYGLMPLWLNHQGVSDSGIGFWMAVMVSAP